MRLLRVLMSNGETRTIRVTGPFATSSIEAVRAACLEGAGIGIMTYWDVLQCLENGSLERIELSDVTLRDHGIWAVYPTRQQLPKRIRAFINQLKALFVTFQIP
jgi:DNA-binding transcriptional LysR family regulator